MKYWILLYMTLLCVMELSGNGKLSENGKPCGSIYVAEDAIPAEKTAAKELQYFIEQISGAKLPVVHDRQQATIIIGQDAELTDIDFQNLRPDEIVIRTKGNRLYLAGGRPRGTLYSVYEFLEQQLGIRFLTPDETFIPRQKTITVEPLDFRYSPQFETREILYSLGASPEFAARIRANGHWKKIPMEYGGHNRLLGFCHTFDLLIPEKKYFKTNQEWFSFIAGKRIGGPVNGQLCLSNDEMRLELTRNALEMLRKNPSTKMISISQNDNNNYCQCQKCKAVDQAEGSPSGSLLRFINLVAADIEKEFPDVIIETLAYTYTRKAPRTIRPRHNVMIRLCSIECNFNRSLTDKANASFLRDFTDWSNISTYLGIWHYTTNFTNYCIPHPNLTPQQKDFRLFAENNKTIYIFAQGDAANTPGELGELRVWLLRNLLWDPSRDQQALTDEFLKLYYKDAAPEIAEYISLMENEAQRPEAVLGCYLADTSSWLRLDTLLKARKILSHADRKTSHDPALNKKIKRICFTADIALLLRGEYAGFNTKREQYPEIDFKQVLDNVDKERRSWAHFGAEIWNDTMFKRLKKQIMPPEKSDSIPEFCKRLPSGDWLEIQEDSFTLRPPVIHDPRASNGKACEYKTVNGWFLQCPLPSNASEKKNIWDVYLSVRCKGDAANQDTVAFFAGIYDMKRKTGLSGKSGTFRKYMQTDYQWLKLGSVDIANPCYVYVVNYPANITYVDRIVLVCKQQ